MKELICIVLILTFAYRAQAQPANCEVKQPHIIINFGTGNVSDINTAGSPNFERIQGYCPNDGYYAYSNYTNNCFNDHWFTLTEDHTPGDIFGNMMLVNAPYNPGIFFRTTLNGLKSSTTYEFALWMMNVCKFNSYCPYELLPDITILLQTPAGKTVAKFGTREVARTENPHWKRYVAFFTTPTSETTFTLIMINNNPGGCGNDFALDDITFRECVKSIPLVTTAPKLTVLAKSKTAIVKTAPKKAMPVPVKSRHRIALITVPQKDLPKDVTPVLKSRLPVFPPPPIVLITRTNALVKQIETEAGEIRVNLYDNGEVDGDTVSVYHNNVLLMSHARLSQQPVSMRIAIDTSNPHHELIMVAENLGSIPPNTSLMIITAGTKRYEVFISSTQQKNAKVILDLKR